MEKKKLMQKQEDHLLSVTKYRRIIGVIFLLFTIAIWVKVIHTMVVEGPQWRAIAETLRPPRQVDLSPTRGNIYSADGKLLAISPPYYRIYIDFQSQSITLLQQKKLLQERLDSLADLTLQTFPGYHLGKKELLNYWKEGLDKKSRHWDLLRREISFLEYDEFMKTPIMYIKGEKGRISRSSIYRSLYSDQVSRRQKPYGGLAAATIGNVYKIADSTGIPRGSGGLELAYDSLLIGVPGIARMSYIGGRNTKTVVQDPVAGADLYTTFSIDTQRAVHGILKRRLSELKANRGTAIVMEASTGRLIAMANLQFRGGDSTNYTETYPIAFNDLMEPGSTFKAATMMALLDDGYITPESTFDVGNGHWYYKGAHIEDGRRSRGIITYATALALSSNIVPARSAVEYYGGDPQRYIDKIKSFGFGEDLRIELPGYQNARIKDADDPSWSKISLPWIAHGYETQIPPVMMLTFFNAIANGGTVFRPFLVDSILSSSGEVLMRTQPSIIKDSICKPETINALRRMLRGVVTDGTGKVVNSPHVEICGKSGTAQIAQGKYGYRGAGKTHSVTFIGFFPYNNPQYTCIVNIISPRKDLYPSGGTMAGPVVREIAEYLVLSSRCIDVEKMPSVKDTGDAEESPSEWILFRSESEALGEYLGLPLHIPEELRSEAEDLLLVRLSENNTLEVVKKISPTPPGIVPDLIGLSASKASYLAISSGLIPILQGSGYVVSQSLPLGSRVKQGEKLILTLSSPLQKHQ